MSVEEVRVRATAFVPAAKEDPNRTVHRARSSVKVYSNDLFVSWKGGVKVQVGLDGEPLSLERGRKRWERLGTKTPERCRHGGGGGRQSQHGGKEQSRGVHGASLLCGVGIVLGELSWEATFL